MADTLPLVDLPAGVWVNVYAETSLDVGKALVLKVYEVDVLGENVNMAISAAEPASDSTTVFPIRTGENSTTLSSGETGCWAYCKYNARISVQDNS